jgi:nucleoside-diphosphate-sugar epimerase
MSTDNLHVVIGASGATGSATVRELLRKGHAVRAVSRNGTTETHTRLQSWKCDVVKEPLAARAACEGATVVYHCAQPAYTEWVERLPPLTESILDAATFAGAKLVFADNLYSYGKVSGKLHEDLPSAATGKKGQVRADIARKLLAAHKAGRVEVAIGRSSDYFGPGGLTSAAGAPLFGAAVAGKTVRWLGSLDQPHTLHYLDDIARGLVILGERPESGGEVWHLPAATTITGRQFGQLIFNTLDRKPKLSETSKSQLRLAGLFSPLIRELRETYYQWDAPWIVDHTKFERTFGPAVVTPHTDAVAATVAWFAGLTTGAAAHPGVAGTSKGTST